jgi:peroxiredoxin
VDNPRTYFEAIVWHRAHSARLGKYPAAFVADQPLMGVTRIDLRRADSLQKVKIVVRLQSSAEALLSMEDNAWSLARKQKAAAEQADEEKHPAGQRSRPAPELDGAAWYNTDARSLKDFRGRYVLLDFWFIGCGPCHGDFPSVKLVHERFEKHGVTVVGVHDNSSKPEAVREHCRQQGLKFPIVVDHTDGRILSAYRQLGVRSFPSYILIGPDGKILENDSTTDRPSLRAFKLEVIRKYVLDRRD